MGQRISKSLTVFVFALTPNFLQMRVSLISLKHLISESVMAPYLNQCYS